LSVFLGAADEDERTTDPRRKRMSGGKMEKKGG
jgi:hypothetical protein